MPLRRRCWYSDGMSCLFFSKVGNINFFSLLVTFLSFDVKEWVVENDLLVQRLKVSIKVY